jgi:hypothetical protein
MAQTRLSDFFGLFLRRDRAAWWRMESCASLLK